MAFLLKKLKRGQNTAATLYYEKTSNCKERKKLTIPCLVEKAGKNLLPISSCLRIVKIFVKI
jgi:hypothetical protein